MSSQRFDPLLTSSQKTVNKVKMSVPRSDVFYLKEELHKGLRFIRNLNLDKRTAEQLTAKFQNNNK